MPLLPELETGLVAPGSYNYGAPDGAFADGGGCETSGPSFATMLRRPGCFCRASAHGSALGLCPGGTSDNSPTFQRWVGGPGVAPVPKGRLKGRAGSAVPSGLILLSRPVPNVETLGYSQPSLRDEIGPRPLCLRGDQTSSEDPTRMGKARLPNFPPFPARSRGAKSPMGASGPCAARPAMLISCNISARFPPYGVDGGVRRTQGNMNTLVPTHSTMRPVALAALAGPSLRRLGAAPAAKGFRPAWAPAAFYQIPNELIPLSQQKTFRTATIRTSRPQQT